MENDFPPAFLTLISLLTALILSGCTSISFKGKGLIPVYLTPRADHQKLVEAHGHKEFYLWGLIGPDRDVFVDELLYDKGLISAAGLSVHEYQSTGSFMKALFSFGFYIPKEYKVSAKGIEGGSL